MRSNTTPPRIACVGAGRWGMNLVRNFHDLAALEWVCELDAGGRAEIEARYPGLRLTDALDEVLSDPAVAGVAIATPAATHGALVRRALRADKDVFVEKPLCLSVAEGRELVALAADRHRILMVGHLLWYHPAVRRLQQLVDDGELGRIQYIYSNRLNLGRIRREENILWSFAPHDVSVILGLVGERPDAVLARGGNYLHNQLADVTVSTISFPSGVKSHIFVSWLHPFKEQKLVVVGDRQMAVFDDLQQTDKLVVYPHGINWKHHVPVATWADGHPVPVEPAEPLREECQAFLDAIVTRDPPPTDGAEALRVLEVLTACQSSLEESFNDELLRLPPVETGPVASPPPYFVHESSYIDEGVEIGDGTTIWHFSHVLAGSYVGRDCRIGQNVVIGPNVRVGDGVKIQNNVSVYEGVTLEDHVFCGPSVVFTNVYNPRSEIRRMHELRPTLVRHGASLGANATIVCGITVGAYAFVGAGAVVLTDVPEFALVVGNPGRIVGWMCICGDRIDFDGSDDPASGSCGACRRTYRKVEGRVECLTVPR